MPDATSLPVEKERGEVRASCPPPPPPIFQCTPNELVLYVVHTIAYYRYCYIAQYNPSKMNTATYIYYLAKRFLAMALFL